MYDNSQLLMFGEMCLYQVSVQRLAVQCSNVPNFNLISVR